MPEKVDERSVCLYVLKKWMKETFAYMFWDLCLIQLKCTKRVLNCEKNSEN